MKEIWKNIPIKPFNKHYQVSNLGRVRSKYHTIISRAKGTKYLRHVQGKILSPYKTKVGYLSISLSFKDFSKKYSVHRLVGKAFIPNPKNYSCINHKNQNKTDNNVNNLEWCSHKYNDNYKDHNKRLSQSKSCLTYLRHKNSNHVYTFDSELDCAIWLKKKLHLKASLNGVKASVSAACTGRNNSTYGFKAAKF